MVSASVSRAGAGVAAVVEALSRAVSEQGTDVTVVGLEDEAWRDGDADSWLGAPVVACRVRGPKALGYAPEMVDRLFELDPDIVHVHGIWTLQSRSVVEWARVTGRPYIVSPHGMLDDWALANSSWKKMLARVLYENAHLRSASAFHALCEFEAAAIRKLGLPAPVRVIPNGVVMPPADAQLCVDPPWPAELNEDTRVMLFLGRLHPKKNIGALLEAWAQVFRERGDEDMPWKLVIAGWDEKRHGEELKQRCQQLGIGKSVYFSGAMFGSRKDTCYRSASAFILPSVSEGLPMAVLEAWSYGLPVLMTSACNLPEGFSGGAALRLGLSKEEMVRDLANFIFLDRAALHEMSDAARRLVLQEFQWKDVARRFVDFYAEVHGRCWQKL